ALVAVVGARAFAECGVAAFSGGLVEISDRRREPVRVDAGPRRWLGRSSAALEISGGQMTAKRHRKRRHASQAIFAKRAMIANQERCDLFTRLCGLRHGLNEVMVGIAFIGKARALARHRN